MADLRALQDLLIHTPVIAELHPLAPLCLEPGVRLEEDADRYLRELDDLTLCRIERVIILKSHPHLLQRFPFVKVDEPPSAAEINENMHHNLDYAREKLLTNHKIATYIEEEVRRRHYDVVILLLIDGLSYDDVKHWNANVQPAFVDGPSITFAEDEEKNVVGKVGFPAIVNNPTIFARLQEHGYRTARGFTYWTEESNSVSEIIFRGIPTSQVEDFSKVVRSLEHQTFSEKTYIQIVRQGLDGLAHHRRELDREEIVSALESIYKDMNKLLETFKKKGLKTCIYLTADHGILWKEEHTWQLLELRHCHHRYADRILNEHEKEYAVRVSCGEGNYYMLRYPYLANKIPADNCGVHGGLSYEESIVPLVQVEA